MELPRLEEETSTKLPSSSPAHVQAPEKQQTSRCASKIWRLNFAFVLGILIRGVAGLVPSIIHYSGHRQRSAGGGGRTAPVTIGGRFTNIQAKAIDLLCAIILAPLLMVVLDYVWFSNVRASVVNKQSPVPLPSLVEARSEYHIRWKF
ncbi:hypothetical protein ASPCAL08966 [Aspergillus calidoustus]|uniref:Uncharacterized protein n=1 Tax=Aspergillus calidoustus TaxID=454130 RepID=A0A0U5A2D8_ASPCI|nr:hypothetical protein ASPCAL08966 [Aspergillus calidoustus]